MASGALDAITDVPGVTVGHATHASGDVQTGVTVVHAHGQDPYRHKVPAGVAVINGFGKAWACSSWKNWDSSKHRLP